MDFGVPGFGAGAGIAFDPRRIFLVVQAGTNKKGRGTSPRPEQA